MTIMTILFGEIGDEINCSICDQSHPGVGHDMFTCWECSGDFGLGADSGGGVLHQFICRVKAVLGSQCHNSFLQVRGSLMS